MGSSRGRWAKAGIEKQESVPVAREAFLSGQRDGPIGSGFIPDRTRRHGGIRQARKSHTQVPNSGRRDESWD